jgi:2,4-dienoyl-CoA reductase-like NADH-dependent reductase (Old Yellow Enzyme family)
MQLLSKITIGGQELQNRVVLAAMTRGRYVRIRDGCHFATLKYYFVWLVA